MEFSDLQLKALGHIYSSFKNNINPLCALGMGSGKTRIICKTISDIKQSCPVCRILIAAKSTLFEDPWNQELKECGIVDESLAVDYLFGEDRAQYLSENGVYSFPNKIILLTTYDTLVRDIENNRFDINAPFSLAVIDEIQLIMNSKRLTKRCNTIAKLPASRKIALSGTPIQNDSLELGLIYLFLNNPLAFSSARKLPDDVLKAALNDCLASNSVFYDSGEKKEGFEKEEAVLCLPVNKELLAIAETIKNPKKRLMFLSNPNTLYYHFADKPKAPDCAKVEAVKTILSVRRLQKCIIFSQFIDVLYAYEDVLTGMGMASVVITGKDKGKGLKEKMKVFEHSRHCNILLTTLQKSSEGLNLSFATHIIILEFWWNPQKLFQAMNRIDRKGQKHDIFIYLLCYHIEGKLINDEGIMYEAMAKKNEEANEVLQNYTDEMRTEQERKLPALVLINNIEALQDELRKRLKDKTLHNNWDGDEYEETIGKSFTSTLEELKKHPLMLKAGLECAIWKANQAEKIQKQNKMPFVEFNRWLS
jgi:superfamily II DNA or RNA helicase